jgi:hypothetical protein
VAGCSCFLAVVLDVVFGRFRSVMRGVIHVAFRSVRMVSRRFVVARFMMRCGLAMMPSRVLMMFGCFLMMHCRFLGHTSSS